MRGCTRFDPDKTRAQPLEKLHDFRTTQPSANLYNPCLIDAVYLEDMLRDIQPNRANLVHGRLPSSGLRQPHYGTQMPGAGAVHPITSNLTSNLTPIYTTLTDVTWP